MDHFRAVAVGQRRLMEKKLASIPDVKARLSALIGMILFVSRRRLEARNRFEFELALVELASEEAYAELLAAIIEEGIAAGELRQAPADLTVRFIMGILSESRHLLAAKPDLAVVEEVQAAVLRLVSVSPAA